MKMYINGSETGILLKSAESFVERTLGWMGKRISDREGLRITRCDSIHTCFMRFTIDAVFIDASGSVVEAVSGIKPWRFVFPVKNAKSVLELPQGYIAEMKIKEKDVITFK